MTYPTHGPGLFPSQPAPQQHYRYQPAHVQQQAYGWGAPAPAKRSLLPWLIVGLAALLVASGIGLVILIKDDAPGVMADPPTRDAPGNPDAPGNGDVAEPDPREVPSPPTDCLIECTESDPSNEPDTPDTPDTGEANYSGSEDAAVSFVEAIANRDSVSAHATLCGDGKTRFVTPAALLADFYATFGITTITGARLTDVYPADSTVDAVVFELTTDAGDVVAEVDIVEEGSALTVCGYAFS